MWLWKKKKKEEVQTFSPMDLATLENRLDELANMGRATSPLRGQYPRMCPSELRSANLCACMDCQKADTCEMELICRVAKCTTFIRACSYKALLEGKESKCAEIFMEQIDQAKAMGKRIQVITT